MADQIGRRIAAVLLAIGIAVPALAVQVTDDRGVTVTLPAPPRRVVSLLPSLTETVCALGRCDRLVGQSVTTKLTHYPAISFWGDQASLSETRARSTFFL